MTRDYGRPLQFGIFPSPDVASVDELFTMVGVADRMGLGRRDQSAPDREEGLVADRWTTHTPSAISST